MVPSNLGNVRAYFKKVVSGCAQKPLQGSRLLGGQPGKGRQIRQEGGDVASWTAMAFLLERASLPGVIKARRGEACAHQNYRLRLQMLKVMWWNSNSSHIAPQHSCPPWRDWAGVFRRDPCPATLRFVTAENQKCTYYLLFLIIKLPHNGVV